MSKSTRRLISARLQGRAIRLSVGRLLEAARYRACASRTAPEEPKVGRVGEKRARHGRINVGEFRT